MIARLALGFVLAGIAASGAYAQTAGNVDSGAGTQSPGILTMKALLAQGYEIKTAVPNGSKFVVFLQKDQSAYACEFVSLTDTRCGAIN